MKRVQILMLAASLLGVTACTASEQPIPSDVLVYKSSTCPCCEGWMEHMRKEGFIVKTEVHDEDLDRLKRENGITPQLASCHTARIGGYTIEGHVPAEDIKRLLKERPADIIGLTAPGMPMQSPGMQAEGLPPRNYEVIAIKNDGTTSVYHRY